MEAGRMPRRNRPRIVTRCRRPRSARDKAPAIESGVAAGAVRAARGEGLPMDGRSRWMNGSTRWIAVVLGLAAAAASAGLVSPREVRLPTMGSPTGDAPIVGEHSGAGERQVDELNRAISSM